MNSAPPVALKGERHAQCASCGAVFNSDSLFTRHFTGTYAKPGEFRGARRCMTPEEMQAKGWRVNARGFCIRRAMDPAKFGKPEARADVSLIGSQNTA